MTSNTFKAHSPRSIPSITSAKTSTAIPFHRRLLFPSLPLGADTPPIISSATPELNAEVYDFIALSLRAFVNPWWTKITRYDKEFLPEITRIITAVIQTLELRILSTDLSPLVLHELPTLITQHYTDYRTADAKVSTSYATGGSSSLPQLFHQMQPHVAITPEGRIDETYVRQALDHILKTCLPPDDYAPDAERTIVQEIILKVLLSNVIPRITQPWFIQKIMLDILGASPNKIGMSEPPSDVPSSRTTFTLQSFIVFFLSAVQYISGIGLVLIHLYKQGFHTIKVVNSHPSKQTFKAFSSMADYSRPSLDMATQIFTLKQRFASAAVLSSVEMGVSMGSHFLDRLYPYLLYQHAFSPPQIINVVRTAKRTLFPNGYPAPPPIDPTPEEQTIIREQLATRISARLPPFVASILLGPDFATQSRTINAALDPLSSVECNAHLVLFMVDLVLLTLFPELGTITTSNHPEQTQFIERAPNINSFESSSPPWSRPA